MRDRPGGPSSGGLSRGVILAGILISLLVFASAGGLFILGARAYDAERTEAELAARKILKFAAEEVAAGVEGRLANADSDAEIQLRGEETAPGAVSELVLISPEGRILLPRLRSHPPLDPPPGSELALARKYLDAAAREYEESGDPLGAVPFVEEAIGDFDHPDLFASLVLQTARYYALGDRHDRASFLLHKLVGGLEGARDLDSRPAVLTAALMFLTLPGEDPRDREAVAARAAEALADHAFGFSPPERRQALEGLAVGFADGILPERILTRLSFVDALEYRLVPEATRLVDAGGTSGWQRLHVRGPAGDMVLGWRPEKAGTPHVVGYRLNPVFYRSSIEIEAFEVGRLHGVHITVDTAPRPVEVGNAVDGEGLRHAGFLAPVFPALSITVTTEPPATPDRLRVIHVGMSVLLALALATGLWLSLRAVRGERETARVKQHFIDNVSHELRTPLTSIRMYAEMLEEEAELPADKRERYLAWILRESERLSRLVEDVLDFSRVQRGEARVAPERLKPDDIVREAMDLWGPQAREAGFTLSVDLPDAVPAVRADRDSAVRALANLIGNAIRYSGDSREVEISGSRRNDHVLIEVRDRGPGIPEEAREHLFERFYRAPRDARRTKGVGLGLVLAREIARSQGGDVLLLHTSDSGSTFAIALPIDPGGMSARVLVVEDEQPIREGLLDRLRREGFSADGAEDGESAAAALAGGAYDMVILDLMLPGISGEEVLTEMRRRDDETPVLVLSARGQEVDRVLLLTLGADDYVVKPFSVRELIARIRAILRRTAAGPTTGTVRFADVTLDLDGFRITKGDEVHPITATERGMLELLWSRRGRLVTRREFLERVWGYDRLPETRTVDFHIVRLRRKIEDRPERPRYLKTVRGQGYLLEPGD